jgi:hypothetical protein
MTDEGGVLGNLPNSRPGRRSAKRDRPADVTPAGSAKPKSRARRTTAVKGGGTKDAVRLEHDMGAQVGHNRTETAGDPLSAAVRTAAGLAATGVKVAGAVGGELLRRLPRP